MLWRLFHIERDLGTLTKGIEQQTAGAGRQAQELAAGEEQLKTLRREQALVHKDCMKLEKALSKLNKDLDQRVFMECGEL